MAVLVSMTTTGLYTETLWPRQACPNAFAFARTRIECRGAVCLFGFLQEVRRSRERVREAERGLTLQRVAPCAHV